MRAGDYAVVRTKGFVGWAIRVMTRSHYNHAFILIDELGGIIEAGPQGAAHAHLWKYTDCEQKLSRLNISEYDRWGIVSAATALIGKPYGFGDLVWLGLLQWGIRWGFVKRNVDNHDDLVCSQLVALAYLWGANIHLSRDPDCPLDVTPQDLYLDIMSHERDSVNTR